MAIQFERPWLLLLLLPLAAILLYLAKDLKRLVRWRRNSILILRGIVFLLVVLLLSGFVFEHASVVKTTLFLVDSSDSIRDKEKGVRFIKEALKGMGREDEAGIINFGRNASIELLPDKNPVFTDIETRIDPSYTNLENALVTAQSVMPWENKKRVVLITDGRENTGNVLKHAKRMKETGYSIDVYPVVSDMEKEVQLQELKVPDSVSRNSIFEININVRSNIRCDATLNLYTNRTLTGQKKVRLNEGENHFAFTDKSEDGGMVTYRVEVIPEEDTFIQNNSLSSFTYIEDIPKILIVKDENFGSNPLEDILKEDMEVTVLNSGQVPKELSELLKYDAFILDNIPADDLDEKFLENLEVAVSHQGKGLLACGGDESYGPGGYFQTPLEKILPVNMDIKSNTEDPNLALILVIDKSSSMSGGEYGISKMEMAREAAIRATEALSEKDYIGVIAFDSAYKWVVKPQKLDNLAAIQEQIASIRAGGGTQILPALEEAYSSILEADAKLKHIILLTDGQAEKTGHEPVIDGLRENGITLSTVACGSGADTLLMKALAYGGKGRYYETDEFSDIPKIFTKEIFLAGKNYLVNKSFMPSLAGYSDILKGIDAVPGLDGYVATTPKRTANIIFESDEGDPVLAAWQYGLGRAVAWTPDIHGIWSYDWMSWDDAPVFWKNLVSWLVQQNLSKGYSVSTEIKGQQGTIIIRAEEDAFTTADNVSGTLINPDGTKQDIKLYPGAPGEYKGTFENLSSGVYVADITLTGKDGQSERISAGLIMPYSKEYDFLSGFDESLLQKIAYEGGGRLLKDPKDVFSGQLQSVSGKVDPSPVILIILTLLFMLDVALRRIRFNPGKWRRNTQNVLIKGKAAAEFAIGAAFKMQEEKKDQKKIEKKAKLDDMEVSGKNESAKKESVKKKSENKDTGSEREEAAETHISYLLEQKRKWKR